MDVLWLSCFNTQNKLRRYCTKPGDEAIQNIN